VQRRTRKKVGLENALLERQGLKDALKRKKRIGLKVHCLRNEDLKVHSKGGGVRKNTI
jgi:hypothetical protein